MIKNTYFCDTCEKEFNPQEGILTMASVIPKINDKLEKMNYTFNGNYCGRCSEIILSLLGKLKEDYGKLSNPEPVGEPAIS
mgnify:CR=1 FL=1